MTDSKSDRTGKTKRHAFMFVLGFGILIGAWLLLFRPQTIKHSNSSLNTKPLRPSGASSDATSSPKEPVQVPPKAESGVCPKLDSLDWRKYGCLRREQIETIKGIEKRYDNKIAELKHRQRQTLEQLLASAESSGRVLPQGQYFYHEQTGQVYARSEFPQLFELVDKRDSMRQNRRHELKQLLSEFKIDNAIEEEEDPTPSPFATEPSIEERVGGMLKNVDIDPSRREVLKTRLEQVERHYHEQISSVQSDLQKLLTSLQASGRSTTDRNAGVHVIVSSDNRLFILNEVQYAAVEQLEHEQKRVEHELVMELREYVRNSGWYDKTPHPELGAQKYRMGYWEGMHIGCACGER